MALCEKWEERILALYDEMLDEKEAEEVRAHLGACENCREEWEALLAMKEMLREMPKPKLPEGFMEDFRTRLSEEGEPKIHHSFERKINWRSYATIAAALLVFVALRGLGDNVTHYPVEENPPAVERPYIENAKIQGAESLDSTASPDEEAAIGSEPDISYTARPKVNEITENHASEGTRDMAAPSGEEQLREPLMQTAPTAKTEKRAEESAKQESASEEAGNTEDFGVMATALSEEAADTAAYDHGEEGAFGGSGSANTADEAPASQGWQRAKGISYEPLRIYQAVLSEEAFEALKAAYPVRTVSGAEEAYNGKPYVEAEEGLLETLSVTDEAVFADVTDWENRDVFSGKTIVLIEVE